MAGRKRKGPVPRPATPRHLPVVPPDAAGIDVGAAEHWVAVPPDRDPSPVRRLAAFTDDLNRLADWLAGCGVRSVAMEATGVYGIPLFELLERRGFEVILVDPRQTRAVKGRPKTDRLDCQRGRLCGVNDRGRAVTHRGRVPGSETEIGLGGMPGVDKSSDREDDPGAGDDDEPAAAASIRAGRRGGYGLVVRPPGTGRRIARACWTWSGC